MVNTSNTEESLLRAARAAVCGPSVKDISIKSHGFNVKQAMIVRQANSLPQLVTGEISHRLKWRPDDDLFYNIPFGPNGLPQTAQVRIDRSGFTPIVNLIGATLEFTISPDKRTRQINGSNIFRYDINRQNLNAIASSLISLFGNEGWQGQAAAILAMIGIAAMEQDFCRPAPPPPPPSTPMTFIPRSIVETSMTEEMRREVIQSRRTEHDEVALNLEVCLYLNPQGADRVSEGIQTHYCTEFQPVSGKLPADLWGYAFYIAPVPPQTENNPAQFARGDRMALNGDGMIYRLGFDQSKATLKTRIAKPPCYYADLATQLIPKYDRIGFRFLDGGMVRHSLRLGTRNQLNTAFLATRDHLLVTFDGARPYVVDPDTLELLQPVGTTSEWIGLGPKLPPQLSQVFQPYSNPAHPVCDHSQIDESSDSASPDEIYTANYSQGLSLVREVNRFRRWLIRSLARQDQALTDAWGGFTRLVRYRLGSQAEFHSWQLFLPNGEPVVIEQAIHQMALTEDYIILGDIAFEIEISQIFSPFLFGYLRNKLTKKVGYWLSLIFLQLVQPLPFANLYIVSRKDLDSSIDGKLVVTKVTLPHEISHFVADYQNLGGRITLHGAHSCGWDVTEWIGEYDEAISLEYENIPRGLLPGPVDLNQMARYEIDADKNGSGESLHACLISDPGFNDTGRNTWSLSVNTHRNLKRDDKSETSDVVKNIYWMSWGFSWEIVPKRIYRAYKTRDVRTIPCERLPDNDKPMTLLRLNTEQIEIADSFEFPIGYFVRSPQFIPSSAPCPEGMDESTHGYIVCVVQADDEHDKPKDEFWVFHADDFKGKPIYRLSHPQVSLSSTIHSTWLPNIQVGKYSESERQEIRRQSLEHDYGQLIRSKGGLVQQLFEEIVFPCFREQTLEQELLNSLRANRRNQVRNKGRDLLSRFLMSFLLKKLKF